MGPDRLSRNVGSYQSTLRKVPEERRSKKKSNEISRHELLKMFQGINVNCKGLRKGTGVT